MQNLYEKMLRNHTPVNVRQALKTHVVDKIQITDCHIVTQSPALKGNQFTFDVVTFLGSL